MKRYALISVYDRTGIDALAHFFVNQGITILSTGGTAQYLQSQGIPVESVGDFTGYPEIMDGRVKSLHPKIHAGILCRSDRDEDLLHLAQVGSGRIEYVVVNLYPFTQKIAEIEAERNVQHGSLVELIDIGGPTMIRGAAKNHQHVVPLIDPEDYDAVIGEVQSKGSVAMKTRQQLAMKVFSTMAVYDGAIARYFSLEEQLLEPSGERRALAPIEPLILARTAKLRYGENPHQQGALYSPWGNARRGGDETGPIQTTYWRQLQGKELSYNNLLDMQAAVDLFLDIHSAFPQRHTAVIVKHSNPCGAAVRATPLEAFTSARACDPASSFGGIIVLSGMIDGGVAASILEGFVELIVAAEFSVGARKLIEAKKNIRAISCDFEGLQRLKNSGRLTIRDCGSQFLLQSADDSIRELSSEQLVTGVVDADRLGDLEFAWRLCKHIKSNAIVIAKDLQAIGVGAGQMSRVDSARLAISRARDNGFDPAGAVSASDAFLPFTDALEILNDGGVTALVQPGGSLKDEDVVSCARKRGVTMLVTGERHFRH